MRTSCRLSSTSLNTGVSSIGMRSAGITLSRSSIRLTATLRTASYCFL